MEYFGLPSQVQFFTVLGRLTIKRKNRNIFKESN